MNVIDLMNLLKSGKNPQEIATNYLRGSAFGSSPMGKNLAQLAQTGDQEGIEKIARNLCAQKGVDFDAEFSSFKKMLGIK